MSSERRTVVVGASGLVGAAVTRAFGVERVVQAHRSAVASAGAIRFDVMADDLGEMLDPEGIETVVFAAHVEHLEADAVVAAMRRLVERVSRARFVYLSTDAVFSGSRGLYVEGDVADGVSAYGRTSSLCEEVVRRGCRNHCVVRPSHVFGVQEGSLDARSGRVEAKLVAGETVELFEDMYKSPLEAGTLGRAVRELAMGEYVGVVHVAGARRSVYAYMRAIMEARGVDTEQLVPVRMPTDRGFARDTSLDTSLWRETLGGAGLIGDDPFEGVRVRTDRGA